MKLTSMSEDELCGVYWDIRSESEQSFAVNLANGTHTGGVDNFCEGASSTRSAGCLNPEAGNIIPQPVLITRQHDE
jgi:hypothetical protein